MEVSAELVARLPSSTLRDSGRGPHALPYALLPA